MKKHSNNKKKVAIQGWRGSFHHMAAELVFGNHIEIIPCRKFTNLFEEMDLQNADHAVMAIENTVAGTIRENYALLRKSNYLITGEIILRIEQNLLALPGQNIQDIRQVHSHPMALAQCRRFLNRFPHIELIESDDTALSAKEIAENQIYGRAAIASRLAASNYELEILNSSIEDDKANFTRFFILEKEQITESIPNKASICLALPHKTGSLANLLNTIASFNINLTKIESLPIIGQKWAYEFYFDLLFSNPSSFQLCLCEIEKQAQHLQILGTYNEGIEYSPAGIEIENTIAQQSNKQKLLKSC